MESFNSEKREKREKFERAAAKFRELGPLGVTAEDHRAIGSTPEEFMASNPDKTRAELMTDDEIKEFLLGMKNFIQEWSDPEKLAKEKGGLPAYLEITKQKYKLTLNYLKSINRLPEEFKN